MVLWTHLEALELGGDEEFGSGEPDPYTITTSD